MLICNFLFNNKKVTLWRQRNVSLISKSTCKTLLCKTSGKWVKNISTVFPPHFRVAWMWESQCFEKKMRFLLFKRGYKKKLLFFFCKGLDYSISVKRFFGFSNVFSGFYFIWRIPSQIQIVRNRPSAVHSSNTHSNQSWINPNQKPDIQFRFFTWGTGTRAPDSFTCWVHSVHYQPAWIRSEVGTWIPVKGAGIPRCIFPITPNASLKTKGLSHLPFLSVDSIIIKVKKNVQSIHMKQVGYDQHFFCANHHPEEARDPSLISLKQFIINALKDSFDSLLCMNLIDMLSTICQFILPVMLENAFSLFWILFHVSF